MREARAGSVHDVALEAIACGPRLRPAQDEHVAALVADIATRGLLQPIVVRSDGERLHLVAGRARWLACRHLGWETIPAIVLDAHADAPLAEVAENLIRNDLTALARALAIGRLCDAFAAAHPRGRGGDRRSAAFRAAADDDIALLARLALWGELEPDAGEISKCKVCTLKKTPEFNTFEGWAYDRLGLSRRAIFYGLSIARNILPALVAHLWGHPVEDRQSVLLEIAREGAGEQAAAAARLAAGETLETVLFDLIGDSARDGDKMVARVGAAFARLNRREKRAWVRLHARELRALLDEVATPGKIAGAGAADD